MTISIDKGFNTTGVLSVNLPIAAYDFATVFRSMSDKPGEIILTNLSSPVDRPEKLRTAYEVKKDVYKGSGVNPAYMPPSLEGLNLLIQETVVLSLKDSVDPAFRIDLPVGIHLVLKMPTNEYITPAIAQELIGRTLGLLWDPNAGETGEWRLSTLMRGALKPTGI